MNDTIPSSCQCLENQKVYNNTCINCNVQYCSFCIEENMCAQCMDTFTYIQEDNICRCPDTYTLNEEDLTCYECNVDFCSLCTEDNVCNTCLGDFVPMMMEDSDNENVTYSVCACPETYEPVS